MAWRRGFFRLWIAASALWALGCVVVLQPWTSAERAWSLRSEYAEMGSPSVRPRDDRRNLVRVKQNVQRMADAQESETTIDAYITSEGATVEAIRALSLKPWERYATGALVTREMEQALTNAHYRRARSDLLAFLAVTLGPIVLTLGLGSVMGWVAAGFRRV